MKFENECDSNPILNVSGSYHERLIAALALTGEDAVGYKFDGTRLVFFKYFKGDTEVQKFPGKAGAEMMANWVEMWLANEANYPKEPDHDGSNTKGWRVYVNAWGVIPDYGSFVAVEPHWIMHGK